ncbi:right-handed parallel beta-helix repeat-containing protein [Paenibacillus mesophilus]|uniref:right-handed parallel beta-helix repeat-containing protein n=1 Tax=Paenibacillus mesophilus TaxID=2582849 RepID=UPI0013053D3A|nr:right-handed parallel beta-helix repeat-containing protein [Paenibacillus mesophilus]
MRVKVTNNTFSRNVNGMRLVQKNVDVVSGNLFTNNSGVGLILFAVDGVLVTQNKFIRNEGYGISGGHRTDVSVQIYSVYMTDNIFEDNAPQTTASSSGFSARLYVRNESSIVVFNNNVQYSTPSAPFKMRGISVDKDCIARANNNMSKNLYDNDNPHARFAGVGNYSVNATVPQL